MKCSNATCVHTLFERGLHSRDSDSEALLQAGIGLFAICSALCERYKCLPAGIVVSFVE